MTAAASSTPVQSRSTWWPLPPPERTAGIDASPFPVDAFLQTHFATATPSTTRNLGRPVRRLEVKFTYDLNASDGRSDMRTLADMSFDGYDRPLAFFLHLLHPLGVALRYQVEYLIASTQVSNLSRGHKKYDPSHENLVLMPFLQDKQGRWRTLQYYEGYWPSAEEYPLQSQSDSFTLSAYVRVYAHTWEKSTMAMYLNFGACLLNLPLLAQPLQLAIIKGECQFFDRTYLLREVGRNAMQQMSLAPLQEYNPTHFGEPRLVDKDGLPLLASALSSHLLYEPKHPDNEMTDKRYVQATAAQRARGVAMKPPILLASAKSDAARQEKIMANYGRSKQLPVNYLPDIDLGENNNAAQ